MEHRSTNDKNKLVSAKQELQSSLGDEWSIYLEYLKHWFRGKTQKFHFSIRNFTKTRSI